MPDINREIKLNLSYIGGFFDGEGCISIDKSGGLRLILTNTNYQILQSIYIYFGNKGKITTKIRTKTDHARRECYQWITWCKDAENILKQLKDYLIIKKREADLALLHRATITSKHSPKGKFGNTKPTEAIYKYRAELVAQLKTIKWEGKTYVRSSNT